MTSEWKPRWKARCTLPNVISGFRLVGAFPLLFLLVANERLAAGVLLGVLGVSDWVDGYMARWFNLESTFGKKLDPLADRAVMILAGGGAWLHGSIPRPLIALALLREIGLGALVAYKFLTARVEVAVRWSGKVGAFSLFVSFTLFLVFEDAPGSVSLIFWAIGLFGVACNYYSVTRYLPELLGKPPTGPNDEDFGAPA